MALRSFLAVLTLYIPLNLLSINVVFAIKQREQNLTKMEGCISMNKNVSKVFK
jgi:peptide deformylase